MPINRNETAFQILLKKISTQDLGFDVYNSDTQRIVHNKSFANQVLKSFSNWFLRKDDLSEIVFDSFKNCVTNNNTVPISLGAAVEKLVDDYSVTYPYKNTGPKETRLVYRFLSEYLFEREPDRAINAISEFVNKMVLFVKDESLYEREAVLSYLEKGMPSPKDQSSLYRDHSFKRIRNSVSDIHNTLEEKLEAIFSPALLDDRANGTFHQWFTQSYRDLHFLDTTFSPDLTTEESVQSTQDFKNFLTKANREFISSTDLNQLNTTLGHYQPNSSETEQYQLNRPTISSDNLTLPLLFAATGVSVFIFLFLMSLYLYKKYKSNDNRDANGADLPLRVGNSQPLQDIDFNLSSLSEGSHELVYDRFDLNNLKDAIENAEKLLKYYYDSWATLSSHLTVEETGYFNSLFSSLKNVLSIIDAQILNLKAQNFSTFTGDDIDISSIEASLGMLFDLLYSLTTDEDTLNLPNERENARKTRETPGFSFIIDNIDHITNLKQLSNTLLSFLKSHGHISDDQDFCEIGCSPVSSISLENERGTGSSTTIADNLSSMFYKNRGSTSAYDTSAPFLTSAQKLV